MRTSRHDAKGFSLVELAIVVGVFGILVAISVPAMSGYLRSSRLRGAATTLVSDLRYAHTLANAQRRTFAVAFSASSYTVVCLSPLTTVRSRSFPREVACVAPDTARFYAWGLTEPATITISDHNRSNVVRLLTTGSVSHD
jgi:prepilin-type N-terminal cleavage/methylation domain-containing protein